MAAAQQGNLHTENNYTIILGSHRNSCLKIEKELAGPYHQVHAFCRLVCPPLHSYVVQVFAQELYNLHTVSLEAYLCV